MDRKKVLLFAMTGFGNSAFKVLSKLEVVDLLAVFMPKRSTSRFPYYKCEPLQDIVLQHKNIHLYEDVIMRSQNAYHLIQELSPDLIVVSTFNQIIPQNIISIPRIGMINVHPSLLPKYKGPTPTVWVLINGEEETGVSVHFIEDQRIDSGRIITQFQLKIESTDTNGTLRHRLAILSEKALYKAIMQVFNKSRENFPEQEESSGSYYPKPTPKDVEVDIQKPLREIINQIRAMTPYPGAYLHHEGTLYQVLNASSFQGDGSPTSSEKSRNSLFIRTSEGIVKFDIQKEK